MYNHPLNKIEQRKEFTDINYGKLVRVKYFIDDRDKV